MKLTGYSRCRRLWCSYNIERGSFDRLILAKEGTECSRKLDIDREGVMVIRGAMSGEGAQLLVAVVLGISRAIRQCQASTSKVLSS
jgi:hypothetical protein